MLSCKKWLAIYIKGPNILCHMAPAHLVHNAETANPVNWYLISGEGDCGEGDCVEGDCGEGEWIPIKSLKTHFIEMLRPL